MASGTLHSKLAALPKGVRQYLIVTGNYWAFTLTDGALRMLVVLYFHELGYSPFEIAMLFLFYEIFGVVTNLVGGWLGARLGLNRTMNIGLFLQIVALSMLLVPASFLAVPWVMTAQALSGIAKDLNKMSAKSAIKSLVPADAQGQLYRWVALLTGSKNTLKGVGFFLGGVLLTFFGFRGAVFGMAVTLFAVWLFSLFALERDLGRAKNKPKFRDIFSKSQAVNSLSAARLFLFGARDVWFVVALPVFLASTLGWNHWRVGGFLAVWIIGYGVVQGLAPKLTGSGSLMRRKESGPDGVVFGGGPDGRTATAWAIALVFVPAAIALALFHIESVPILDLSQLTGTDRALVFLLPGLLLFGVLFAINSSLHSYLIIRFAGADGVSLDVGFYYMANAAGRLVGTVLSGWLYQRYGLEACLWVSFAFITVTVMISFTLPRD